MGFACPSSSAGTTLLHPDGTGPALSGRIWQRAICRETILHCRAGHLTLEAVREKPRILLIDDDAHLRDPIAVTLRNKGYDARAEADGRRFGEVVEGFRPDLVILDVRLPVGPSGFELGRTLRSRSERPLLYLTAADSVTERLEGFDAGADDYLAKPFHLQELLARVEALLRRSGRLTSSVLTVGDVSVDEEARKASRAGTILDLTRTEYELLHALVRHPGQVLSKEKLLTQVWGVDHHDTNIVEVHVSALRRKLEAKGPRMVHTERSVGYVMRP